MFLLKMNRTSLRDIVIQHCFSLGRLYVVKSSSSLKLHIQKDRLIFCVFSFILFLFYLIRNKFDIYIYFCFTIFCRFHDGNVSLIVEQFLEGRLKLFFFILYQEFMNIFLAFIKNNIKY